MKICDLNTGLGRLAEGFSQFKERLAEVKSHWNDDALLQFEQNHLQEIPARMQRMLAAVQHLADVVERAERECEDRPEET